jgi:hypothetical protein
MKTYTPTVTQFCDRCGCVREGRATWKYLDGLNKPDFLCNTCGGEASIKPGVGIVLREVKDAEGCVG